MNWFTKKRSCEVESLATFLYVSILLSAGLCKKNSSERYPQLQKIVNDEIIFVRGKGAKAQLQKIVMGEEILR